jgi:hypothetical protein
MIPQITFSGQLLAPMKVNSFKKSMSDIRRETLWDSVFWLPVKVLDYWMLGGLGFALGVIVIDWGWEPAMPEYGIFIGFSALGLGWGIVGGIQHYFFTKRLYGDKWKED